MNWIHSRCAVDSGKSLLDRRLRSFLASEKTGSELVLFFARLEAIYPRPRLSQSGGQQHRKYPYLLRGLTIERSGHVWVADITHIRLWQGLVYLVAIMDWHSRYVLSWALSTTLAADFCVEALREALAITRPEIFNTDQAPQFTADGGHFFPKKFLFFATFLLTHSVCFDIW